MRYGWLVVLVLAAGGCREADGPLGGEGHGMLIVESDPQGGQITLDSRSTGKVTPDTLRGVSGLHDVTVELDTMLLRYKYSASVVVPGGDDPVVLSGPLMARCLTGTANCSSPYHTEHVVGNVRFGTNALGPLFLKEGQGRGLYWPAQTDNSYISTATPVFAAKWDGTPVSTGIYDTEFFAGRPAPVSLLSGSTFRLTQSTWLLPPLAATQLQVARGIQIDEQVVASTSIDGVFLVRLTFTNITNTQLYGIVDRVATLNGGITYTDAYIGLAADPDIGDAGDDWTSYDPATNTVFSYDAAFSENGFTTERTTPGIVGLRVLRAPTGAEVRLNSWVNTSQTALDWRAGTTSQIYGYGMLSGTEPYPPDQEGLLVGHLPTSAGDARIVATAGPLRLAPGASQTIVLAIAIASPTPGTFTSGADVVPGDPTDATRPLYAITSALRAKLLQAEQLLSLLN